SATYDLEVDGRQAGEAELFRGSRSDINDSATGEGATIIDANHDRTAVSCIGDANRSAKRQRTMGRCKVAGAGSLAARRFSSFIRVDRRNTGRRGGFVARACQVA